MYVVVRGIVGAGLYRTSGKWSQALPGRMHPQQR